MTPHRRLLYGSFPRKVGGPPKDRGGDVHQFSVFTEEHFERAVRKSNERGNVYASISRLPIQGPESDKVFFDLDADVETLESMHESEQFDIMREDPDVAEQALGDVVADMHTLATASIEDGIPIIGLFSGKGVHLHQMYQTTVDATNEILSTGNKYTNELDLTTADPKVFEPIRISKIPNTKRFDNGTETGVWTIPLTATEMTELTPSELLAMSRQPREPPLEPTLLNESMRPEMQVYDDYLRSSADIMPERELGEKLDVSDDVESLVREFIELPCVRERILTEKPDHKIRWNFAVMMFNYGFTKSEVEDIIRELSWVDYDPEMTRKQIESIWKGKKGDMSCRGLMKRGFCVRRENPKECQTYGWSGGNQLY